MQRCWTEWKKNLTSDRVQRNDIERENMRALHPESAEQREWGNDIKREHIQNAVVLVDRASKTNFTCFRVVESC